jgi:arylsulfatase
MNNEDKKHCSHLPMPNTARPQFIAYDAKDPDNSPNQWLLICTD